MLVIELVCWCVGCGSGLSGISRGVGEKNKMRWKVRVSSAVCVHMHSENVVNTSGRRETIQHDSFSRVCFTL